MLLQLAQPNFFTATIVWDDEPNIEENHQDYLFCAYDSEDDLKPTDPDDDDIFHYGLSYEEAFKIVGKTGSESGQGEFTIVSIEPSEEIKVTRTTVLTINAPEWFENEEFLAWINTPETNTMTWHKKGEPTNEFSDICVWVEPSLNGEGTDSDMPDAFWDAIIELCKRHVGANAYANSHIPIRLTNLK